MRPRGHPKQKGARSVWPPAAERGEVSANELDFDRVETLVGTLLSHEWPGAGTLGEDARNGEAIANYVATLSPQDKDLLLREYLLMEVMLDEVDGPSVANAVDTYLPAVEIEPGA
jgi:hypothetical protein